jgi:hypothetical protein
VEIREQLVHAFASEQIARQHVGGAVAARTVFLKVGQLAQYLDLRFDYPDVAFHRHLSRLDLVNDSPLRTCDRE